MVWFARQEGFIYSAKSWHKICKLYLQESDYLTGGEKVFAAGADIGQMANATAVDVTTSDKPSHRAFQLTETMPKPVIAAIVGYALGGGCELTWVADIRIAAENALFGLQEIKLGILPGAGGTQRLPRLIGQGRAKELIFGGDFLMRMRPCALVLFLEKRPAKFQGR